MEFVPYASYAMIGYSPPVSQQVYINSEPTDIKRQGLETSVPPKMCKYGGNVSEKD